MEDHTDDLTQQHQRKTTIFAGVLLLLTLSLPLLDWLFASVQEGEFLPLQSTGSPVLTSTTHFAFTAHNSLCEWFLGVWMMIVQPILNLF